LPNAIVYGFTWMLHTAVLRRSHHRPGICLRESREPIPSHSIRTSGCIRRLGCGCILYRDPQAAAATFSHDAEYTRRIGLSHDEAFAFWDIGPELSRPFRALTVWLQIKLYGARKLAEAVESNMECARHFGGLIESSHDFELLVPVALSIFCFRLRPHSYTGDLDKLNEQTMVNLQRAGSSYLSNTSVGGKFALRGCVLNYRTTMQDMDSLLEDVREAGRLALAG
jgi:aromatic-L-amino-acid decarboxylase